MLQIGCNTAVSVTTGCNTGVGHLQGFCFQLSRQAEIQGEYNRWTGLLDWTTGLLSLSRPDPHGREGLVKIQLTICF